MLTERQFLHIGSILLGLGLIAVGGAAVVLPEASAAMFGVPNADPAWVGAAGIRDVAFGALVLVLSRQLEALRWCLTCLMAIPLGDATLVYASGAPAVATLPHVVGAVVILVLSILAWKRAP